MHRGQELAGILPAGPGGPLAAPLVAPGRLRLSGLFWGGLLLRGQPHHGAHAPCKYVDAHVDGCDNLLSSLVFWSKHGDTLSTIIYWKAP